MKILKQGNENSNNTKFVCKKCGCEFECSDDEYWIDNSITLTSYPASYNAYASCPICHKVCHTYTHKNTNNCTTAYNITIGKADTSICK